MENNGLWIGMILFVLLFGGMFIAMHIAEKHGGGKTDMFELIFHAADKRRMADALMVKAKELRAEAHADRPLPDFWRVGMRIRYITHKQWGWDKGTTGVIVKLMSESQGKPAAENQVFYTNSTGEDYPTLWTTPDDVELIPEDE